MLRHSPPSTRRSCSSIRPRRTSPIAFSWGFGTGLYRGAVIGAFLMGILYGLQNVEGVKAYAQTALAAIPLGEEGFAWIFTAVIGGLFGGFLGGRKPGA